MRNKELKQQVQHAIERYFDADVAAAVVNCEAFGALCGTLNRVNDGSVSGIQEDIRRVWENLSDQTADWLVGDTDDGSRADAPAAFVASLVE